MPRLGYSKVRTGCLKCRQRRVKCDEKRPCTACERHGVVCSLVENDSAGKSSPTNAGSNLSSSVSAAIPAVADFAAHLTAVSISAPEFLAEFSTIFSAASAHVPLADPPSAECHSAQTMPDGAPTLQDCDWATDMELMHHYATLAYLTLPRADEVAEVWQLEAVRIAHSYHYLLHLILAFSASHLAHIRPDQERYYCHAAAQHQCQGVREMRAALTELNPESCHALFMAGSFLAIGNFGALTIQARDKDDPRPAVNDIVDVFVLLKGMATVLNSSEEQIQNGPFTRLFNFWTPSYASLPFWSDFQERLDQLRGALASSNIAAATPDTAALVDRELLRLSVNTEQSLSFSSVPALRFIMLWPIEISDEFILLLRHKDPAALVILGHYCVVLHATQSYAWFTKGWATKLLCSIDAILSPEWKEFLQWPLERVDGDVQMHSSPIV